MSSRKASRKCLLSYVVLFVTALLVMGFILVHSSIKHHLSELCRYKCGEILNKILSEAAAEAASSDRSYYHLLQDSGGRILSVEADAAALNELQSFLRSKVNEEISCNEYDNVDLTLGDLTDIAYLSGRGPEISIRYQRSGTVDTRYETGFESAGINQTRLRVSVIVSVEFTAFLPTGDESFSVSEEFVAADTVVVGDIPDYISRELPV